VCARACVCVCVFVCVRVCVCVCVCVCVHATYETPHSLTCTASRNTERSSVEFGLAFSNDSKFRPDAAATKLAMYLLCTCVHVCVCVCVCVRARARLRATHFRAMVLLCLSRSGNF
jgi:hypothetical protein